MSPSRSLAVVLLAIAGSTLFFWLVIHQISGLWLDMALRPDVRQALQQSMEDQKRLRALDLPRSDEYRRRFETTQRLVHRLEVIRMSRERMLQRFELALVTIFAVVSAIAATSVWTRYRRAQARERAQYLDRVSALQENARRHAHEMKGPLTAAQLELDRAGDLLRHGAVETELAPALESVRDELERLSRFTRQEASFAGIGVPLLRPTSLGAIVEDFCTTFGDAWPNVVLQFAGGDATVCADRDMIRQVLVNLCTNSHRAIDGSGTVTLSIRRGARAALEVSDSGGGIPASLRERVFEPYVTTRRTGEGMGLGLSISRKIMLDHGGDLQLRTTSAAGTTFRLIFGDKPCS